MNYIFISIAFFFIVLNVVRANEQWEKLLHFKSGKSVIENREFFFSDNGRINAQQEYEKNLHLLKFFNAEQRTQFACKFPARMLILAKEIPELKNTYCKDFLIWKNSLATDSISIVFTSQFLSNPASAFGHTFLRLRSYQRDENLNITVNYAAEIPQDISLLDYIKKGLFGGFAGSFSFTPFYIKKQEYRASEMRDLVEFKLNLNQAQIDLILAHLWELEHSARFSYYFLKENCSLMLLDILAVAVPNLSSPSALIYISPLETIRYLKEKKLLGDKSYHPSVQSKFLVRFGKLNSQQKKEFKDKIGKEKFNNFPDLQLDYYEYLRLKNKGVLPPNVLTLYNHALLKRAESQITISKNLPHPEVENSSPSRKIGITTEYDRELTSTYFNFRPALHEITDPNHGYLQYSSLNFLHLQLRFRNSNFVFSDFRLIEISKLSRLSMLDKSPSWDVKLSLHRDEKYGADNHIIQRNSFAIGYGFTVAKYISAWTMFRESLLTGNIAHHLQFEHQAEIKVVLDYQKHKVILTPSYSLRKDSTKLYRTHLEYIYNLYSNLNFQFQSLYQNKYIPWRNSLGIIYFF